jgi:hypothetical protein
MATTYKNFNSNDVVATKTLLHEVIPLTGSIVSGTYSENNIKNYSHGMFQTVYDYPYLSSSANHIFDLTVGYDADSTYFTASNNMHTKKVNVYNQMAQILVGYDTTGSILNFDVDGNLIAGGTKHTELYFLNFARLLTKDEIKKGSFQLTLGTGSYSTPFAGTKTLYDAGAENDYRVNSPAGEYGILYTSSTSPVEGSGVGLLYYQAGIAVINPKLIFNTASFYSSSANGVLQLSGAVKALSISGSVSALRQRIQNVQFNNTTELNSTIYFCRVHHNEFNYSSNPTYLSGSKIRVKNNSTDVPLSYITTVGLYSADNELLAVAKLSEPLRKDPTNELTIRVRLDY